MVKAVVGANWGDEGKGKITDLFAEEADYVVRFQGGANAGHTIINEYGRFALHILPSGVFHPKTINIIGQGVALNLDNFFRELDNLEANGVPTPKIYISERAQLVLDYHILFDKLEEIRLGKNSYGSTKSGIAPFYSDKYMKIGLQVCELFDDQTLEQRAKKICELKNPVLEGLYKQKDMLKPETVYQSVIKYRERLRPYVADTTTMLHQAIKDNKSILLEGQLGSLKDTDNGIYPFVTSSSPLAGFASVGAGIPPYEIKNIYVIAKAYSSAVGAGAFVSEILDAEEAEQLRKRGGDKGEYGATTGRPRRVGWFDCVATKYGCMLQGATDVVLSLIDVLGYLDKIPICVGYDIDGKVTTDFPCTPLLNRAKPVFEYLDGWKCDIRGIKTYDELPENAKRYVEFIEKRIGFPITMISNGPGRYDIIKK